MKYLPKDVTNRTRGIGGTDIGALFGVSSYKSLPQLWLEKTSLYRAEPLDNEPMQWGRTFEDPVATRFAQLTKRRLVRVHRTIVHPKYDFMLANPDRFQWKDGSRGILEVKTTVFGNLKAWAEGGIPAQYYLQLQHYLEVTGCTWGSFAVLFGGNRLVEFDVQRDDNLIAVMIERERQFWELVQKRQPPPITLTSEWNEHIAEFFPNVQKGEQKQLDSPEAMTRARRYVALKAKIGHYDEELDAHEVFFKAAIADAERLVVPGIATVSWTAFDRSHVDLVALKKEQAEIVAKYTKSIPTRRFTIKSLETVDEDDDTSAL